MYIVPADGADYRFLGGSARDRNTRIAARVGARIIGASDIQAQETTAAVFVPVESALTPALFDDPIFVDAVSGTSARRLESDGGGYVVVGPAGVIRSLALDPAGTARLPRHRVSGTTILTIATPRDRWRSMRLALRATTKATDGWVSRNLNRPLSRACSAVAISLGMSATAASIATLLLGLLTAAIAAQPGQIPLVATGVLFHLASVLDGVDGEIARATLTESDAGALIDTAVDQTTYLSCLAGVTVGWVREGDPVVALTTSVVVGVALLLTLRRAGRFVSEHGDDASFVFVDRSVRRAARDTGHLPLRLAAGAFTLLRRDLFAVIFLVVSLTGERAALHALIMVGIAIANLTFTLYRHELAEAARAERGGPAPEPVIA